MNTISKDHYQNLAVKFEENWFFSQSYQDELVQLMKQTLAIKEESHFLDLGCGTGMFTERIAPKSVSVTGVDFSDIMIELFVERNINYTGLVSDIESFVATSTNSYDFILLKEVIHHVKDFVSFFSSLSKILNKGGKVLIVTRPKKIEFPFFDKALQEFSRQQISLQSLSNFIIGNGFELEMEEKSITINIDKEKLLNMISNRFMSTFDSFSDLEISQGIEELRKLHAKKHSICFQDKLLFLSLTH